MLDWKSLEFLGLVEEYVSAVIKGEKMPSTSTSAGAAPNPVVTSNAHSSATVSPDSFDDVAAFSNAVTAAAAAAAPPPFPNVKYATSGPPEVIFSGVKPATPTSEVPAASHRAPSTLYVMKNVGPNGAGASGIEVGPAATAVMGPLGPATAGPLGAAHSLGSLGGMSSLGDLATFVPVGTTLPLGATLIASPIGVDGSQTLQNVTFTVR